MAPKLLYRKHARHDPPAAGDVWPETKNAADGRWHSILTDLGIDGRALKNRHGPCPGCGGVDRFRFPDKRNGEFFCGQGGDTTGGDGFKLLQHVFSWTPTQSLSAVRDALGLSAGYIPARVLRRDPPKIDVDAKERKGAANAKRVWEQAQPVTGTPGEVYLRSRGIDPDTWPTSVRWHRAGYLVFTVTSPAGDTTAIQRIWVNPDGTPKLEDGNKIKRSLGPQHGRTVILPGVPNGPICIAEGPETGMSVWYATGYETRIGLGTLESVDMEQIPADREIILCRDDDPDKKNKRKNQKQTVQEWRRTHTVKEVFPHHLRRGDKSDFNDVLTTDGKDALAKRIENVLVGPNKNANALPVEEARKKLDARFSEIGELMRQSIGASHNVNLPNIPAFSMPCEPPQLALRVDLGLGKTEAAIKLAVDWQKEGLGPVIYAVPRHDLSDELAERIRKRAPNLKIEIWRGRGADDPHEPGNLDLPKQDRVHMCRNEEAVKDVQAVGGDPLSMVCKYKEYACKFHPCRWTKQRDKSADIWIVAHHSLFARKPKAIDKPSLLIIDEGFWQAGLRGTDGHPIRITMKMIDAIALTLKPAMTADLMAMRAKIRPLFDADIITADMVKLTAKECREAAGMEWGRMVDVGVHPGMTTAERKKAVDVASVNRDIPRLASMWHELANLLETGGESGRLTPVDVENGGATYRAIKLTGINNIKDDWKAPTLHIDATMDLNLVRHWLPNIKLIDDIKAATPYQTVTQYYSKTFSKLSLTYNLKDEKRGDGQKVDQIDKLWAWSKTTARSKGGKWLIIVQKAIEDEIRRRYDIPDFIEIEHHNNVAGRDEWGDVTGLICVGRTIPSPAAVEMMAGAITGKYIKPLEGWFSSRTEMIGNVTVDADTHPDPDAERIRADICEGGLMQIVGRGRGVNRTADNPVEIIILGNIALPIEVDEVREWQTPTWDDVLFSNHGIWVESHTDAAGLLGIPQNTLKTARKRDDLTKGPFSNNNIYIENVPFVKTIHSGTYRRAGRQWKPQRVVWDDREIPDIEAFLAEHVGELAVLEIDDVPEVRQDAPLAGYNGGVMSSDIRLVINDKITAACLSQEAFARQCGMSRPTLANAMLGRYGLSTEAVARLKMALIALPERQPQLFQ